MSVEPYKIKTTATMYATLLPTVVDVCQLNGYACGLHGSMARDLDIIAVPWVEDANAPEVLVKEIADAVGGRLERHYAEQKDGVEIRSYPNLKPHGRKAWRISFSAERYIDISVMPRLEGTK